MYPWLSNSFNGVSGSHQPLNGMNGGLAFPVWHHLRIKLDYSMYRGNNLGDPQRAFFIMAGGQYGASFHRERFYVEALGGEGSLNGTWFSTANSGFKNGNTGTIASFAEFLGGGMDTPLGLHTAFRIDGGIQHSNFDPITPLSKGGVPYHLAGHSRLLRADFRRHGSDPASRFSVTKSASIAVLSKARWSLKA